MLLRFEQGDMSMAAYEANFYALSRHELQLITLEKETIQYSVKSKNKDLQVAAQQVATSRKTF